MIDRSELSSEKKIFFDGVVSAGFPADDDAFRERMQALADDAKLEIANPSKYSSFWNFVNAAVAEPLRNVVRALVDNAIPGFYVKTAAGAKLDLLAWAHGIERKQASHATGKLTFTRAAGAVGIVEIPAGTVARTVSIRGTVRRVATTAAGTIAADAQSVEIPCAADGAGSGWNLGAGYYLLLDSDVPRVGSVTNAADWLAVPGADAETDEELRLRIRDRFLSVGDWHTDAKYRTMISEWLAVRPDQIYFDHVTPLTLPGRGPGCVDAYIIFNAGTNPEDYPDALNAYINASGNHGHGDNLVCKAVPEKPVALSAVLRFKSGISSGRKTAAQNTVNDMIRCSFWENNAYADEVPRSWPYSTFAFSALV